MKDQLHVEWKMIIIAVICVVLIAGVFLVTNLLEKKDHQEETRGDYTMRYAYEDTIEVDGVMYRPKQSITTILVMGIDRESGEEQVGLYNRSGGQADFLRVIVLDGGNRTITQLALDRDTMTPITILGVLGKRSGTRTAQLSLSHGFGNGKEQSCELTVEAVSNLLYNSKIDFYVALNMDGIAALNDALGGVQVTLEDDFSALDPAMTKGTTLKLVGKQAEYYLRSRMNIGIGTNVSRMARQQQYMSQLLTQLLSNAAKSASLTGDVYDAMGDYLVTNIGRGRLINEVLLAKDYEVLPVMELAGTHNVDESGFSEFYVNELDVREKALSLFYDPIL